MLTWRFHRYTRTSYVKSVRIPDIHSMEIEGSRQTPRYSVDNTVSVSRSFVHSSIQSFEKNSHRESPQSLKIICGLVLQVYLGAGVLSWIARMIFHDSFEYSLRCCRSRRSSD